MSQNAVYNNGDHTNDPILGINRSPAYPANNKIMMFTGTDDSQFTRRMARWLERDFISMKRRDYKTPSTLGDSYLEPWGSRVFLDGSDGILFATNVQTDKKLTVMVPDFARMAQFSYINSDWDKYKGLELTRWEIDPKVMLNSTANPDNKMYNTQFSGSINLRTPLQASAVATKGHFYQVSPVVKDQLANIHNRKGEKIKPDQANDDLIIGIE